MSQLPIQTDTSAVCRETGGDIPTKRKGGSLTVHENSAYLFGGLLLDNTTAVSDLYVLDLTTLQWSFISNDDFTPRPRYFHSADRWGDYLVIFGGRSVRQNSATNAFEAFDLDDIQFFHLPSRRWQTQQLPPRSSDVFKPHARYAHISSISGDTLYIFGGQDIHDQWFDEIIVYSLSTRSWIVQHGYPMHIGRYRSTVASFPLSVEFPDTEDDTDSDIAGGTRRRQSAKKLVHLPYTKRHTSADPPAAYLFTNINGADKQLRRYLHTLVPLHDQEGDFTLDNQSRSMGGTPPPGLRFPSSHLAGSHLLVSGVTAHGQNYVFCVYTLDLGTMRWSALHLDYLTYRTGSWHTAAYWPNQNKFLILGDKSSSMTEDYTRRAMSFDHAIVIDLESFGIYQPPEQLADVSAQELGLAALKGQQYTDFELVCDDGRSISCSRKVLEERWPWLKERIQAVRRAGNNAKDRRLTPQAFRLCEPFPTTLALLQYFYSQALITPLQHSPSIRNQLMVIATSYGIPHLAALTRHAMHHDLTTATADSTAKIASICGYPSLQSRALRMVREHGLSGPSSPMQSPTSEPDSLFSPTAEHSAGSATSYEIEEVEREWMEMNHHRAPPSTMEEHPTSPPVTHGQSKNSPPPPPQSVSSEGTNSSDPTSRMRNWLSTSAKPPSLDKQEKKEAKRRKKEEEAAKLAELTERLKMTDPKRKAKEARKRKEDVAMYGGIVM